MEKKKKPIFKRWWFIALVLLALLGALGGGGDDEDMSVDVVQSKGQEIETNNYEVTGELLAEFKDNKIIVTINTNAIDGSIFETSFMDGYFNSVSDFIEIQNGIGTKEFDVPEEWDTGYVSGLAMMRFNLDEHPQTDAVKQMYGEYGEKITGKLAVENSLEGNNVNLDIITIPYPSETVVQEMLDEMYKNAMNELIEISDGVITGIKINDGIVNVTVSDSWYYSAEHEKERFAEQVSDTIKVILTNAQKVESDSSVPVYFYDAYEKELASPKLLGGYKIKR